MSDNKNIALQLTLKAMDMGLIIQKDCNICDGSDPIETANQFAAKQVSDFYEDVLTRINNL